MPRKRGFPKFGKGLEAARGATYRLVRAAAACAGAAGEWAVRNTRDLVRALPAAAVVLMLCGCSARPRPEDATMNIYPLMHGSESNKTLSVAIEIRNVSRRSITFIAPQEASQCGWQEPKYLFAVTNDQGKTYPPCNIFYDPPETIYNESTIITLAPGESLYAYEYPYGVQGTNRFTMSLTYSCDKIKELPKWLDGKKRGWPKDLFVGTLHSPVVTADLSLPLPEEDPIVIPGETNSRDRWPGRTENGLSVCLYAHWWKYQEWTPGIAWINIQDMTKKPVLPNPWSVKVNWYDKKGIQVPGYEKGNKVPGYHYSHPGHLENEMPYEVLRSGSYTDWCTFPDYHIGFQKKAGSYRVSVDLLLKGKRMATSNFIDIEIVPNPLLAESKTNVAPGATAVGR